MRKTQIVSVIKEVELLTVKEIQDLLKISRSKVYELINSEVFPIIKFGKSIRVDKNDFVNWLKNQKEIPLTKSEQYMIFQEAFPDFVIGNQKTQDNLSHKTIREEIIRI